MECVFSGHMAGAIALKENIERKVKSEKVESAKSKVQSRKQREVE